MHGSIRLEELILKSIIFLVCVLKSYKRGEKLVGHANYLKSGILLISHSNLNRNRVWVTVKVRVMVIRLCGHYEN